MFIQEVYINKSDQNRFVNKALKEGIEVRVYNNPDDSIPLYLNDYPEEKPKEFEKVRAMYINGELVLVNVYIKWRCGCDVKKITREMIEGMVSRINEGLQTVNMKPIKYKVNEKEKKIIFNSYLERIAKMDERKVREEKLRNAIDVARELYELVKVSRDLRRTKLIVSFFDEKVEDE